MSTVAKGADGGSDKKSRSNTVPGSADDAEGEEQLSGRAKFRATPIDPAVMKRIWDSRATAPMGAAMRFAHRQYKEEVIKEKQFKGFSRGPLYRDIPENVQEMIGSTKKNKLTFIAGALDINSMPPAVLPEVQHCCFALLVLSQTLCFRPGAMQV
jgi:hypothetical protein